MTGSAGRAVGVAGASAELWRRIARTPARRVAGASTPGKLLWARCKHSLVLTFDGRSQGLAGYFFAYPGQPFGVTVATVDPTGDGYANIVTGFTADVSAVAIYSGN